MFVTGVLLIQVLPAVLSAAMSDPVHP